MNDIDKIFEDWDDEEFTEEFYVGCFVTLDPKHKTYRVSEQKNQSGVIKSIDDYTFPIKVNWKDGKTYRYLKRELIIE